MKRISVLRYHSVEPDSSKYISKSEVLYNIIPMDFREQMLYLKKNNYQTLTLGQLLSIEDERSLPKKPIMLTFDDGHISHYETVLPILQELGFTGVFFLVSNDIGKKGRMNWAQVKSLKHAGMDIGSHGMNHEIMNKYPYQSLIVELKASKLELENTLGNKIVAFSVPHGSYSTKISNVAHGMGYKLVFTSFTGNITLYSNPYRLRRIGIRRYYTMDDFKAIVEKSALFITKKRMGQLAKDGIKTVVGVKTYENIKYRFTENKLRKDDETDYTSKRLKTLKVNHETVSK